MAYWGAIIGAAAQLGSGAIGRSGVSDANSANLAIARENRAWQERMSNTANQRAAADLEAAGLNRILAFGRPASTPSGNIATMQNEQAPIQDAIERGTSTALQARRLTQELKNMKQAERNTVADTSKKMAEANYIQSQDANVQASTNNLILQSIGIDTANQIAKLNEEITRLNIQGVKAESDFYAWLNGASAAEMAKAAGKAGPLALAFIKAWTAINRNRGTKK